MISALTAVCLNNNLYDWCLSTLSYLASRLFSWNLFMSSYGIIETLCIWLKVHSVWMHRHQFDIKHNTLALQHVNQLYQSHQRRPMFTCICICRRRPFDVGAFSLNRALIWEQSEVALTSLFEVEIDITQLSSICRMIQIWCQSFWQAGLQSL